MILCVLLKVLGVLDGVLEVSKGLSMGSWVCFMDSWEGMAVHGSKYFLDCMKHRKQRLINHVPPWPKSPQRVHIAPSANKGGLITWSPHGSRLHFVGSHRERCSINAWRCFQISAAGVCDSVSSNMKVSLSVMSSCSEMRGCWWELLMTPTVSSVIIYSICQMMEAFIQSASQYFNCIHIIERVAQWEPNP